MKETGIQAVLPMAQPGPFARHSSLRDTGPPMECTSSPDGLSLIDDFSRDHSPCSRWSLLKKPPNAINPLSNIGHRLEQASPWRRDIHTKVDLTQRPRKVVPLPHLNGKSIRCIHPGPPIPHPERIGQSIPKGKGPTTDRTNHQGG